ncbi:DUF4129 domain-containing protein [Natronorarus salvus]|uniref:DUF4129 domain-containing protein n=1 Tax=Natronorarus salvus TaxID=3117733 RepID=UPI002F2632BA
MSELSVPDVERRSGVEKRPNETVGEYLTRVGGRAGLPPETVSAVVDHVNRDRFGPAAADQDGPEPPVEEFLRGVDSVGSDDGGDEAAPGAGRDGIEDGFASDEERVVMPLGRPPDDGGEDGLPTLVVLLVAVLVLGGVVAGGLILANGGLPGSSEEAPADEGTPVSDGADDLEAYDADGPGGIDTGGADDDREPIDIGSDDEEADDADPADDAAGALEMTEPLADSDDPDDDYVVLTNFGDVDLDTST